MTLLSTKYNAAKNWAQRLPIARAIWAEIRIERLMGDHTTETPQEAHLWTGNTESEYPSESTK